MCSLFTEHCCSQCERIGGVIEKINGTERLYKKYKYLPCIVRMQFTHRVCVCVRVQCAHDGHCSFFTFQVQEYYIYFITYCAPIYLLLQRLLSIGHSMRCPCPPNKYMNSMQPMDDILIPLLSQDMGPRKIHGLLNLMIDCLSSTWSKHKHSAPFNFQHSQFIFGWSFNYFWSQMGFGTMKSATEAITSDDRK